jgi:hypothetical protein
MTEVISRSDAKARNLTHYFTGIPCKNGHLSRRRTKTCQCLSCVRAAMDAARAPRRAARIASAPVPLEPERVVTRSAAKRRRLRRYFTGVPCVNGHISERRTLDKKCLACHRERRAVVRKTQSTKVKAQQTAYYLRNRKKIIAKVQVRINRLRAERRAARDAPH